MASHPPGDCCARGFKHEGEPNGKVIKIASKWDGYLATPPADKRHEGLGLLYIPDILGLYNNAKLLADQFAAEGYLCVIADATNGDPVPLNFGSIPDFNLPKWVAEGSDGSNPHTKEAVDPIVAGAIKFMKEEYGISKIGAMGYCSGAKYVVRGFHAGIDVGFVAHPTLVEEEELAAITGPLSIAAAETDDLFPAEKRHKSEDILKRTGLPYQINLYSGVTHGFAVRCDLSQKIQRYAKEQAMVQAIAWFDEHLL